jgi:hypothetical protein
MTAIASAGLREVTPLSIGVLSDDKSNTSCDDVGRLKNI